MPKFIENYKLETIDNISIDGMEHFIGKQNGSGKFFILKRFKPQNHLNTQSIVLKNPSSSNQQLFKKLTHQTLILKNLSHSSIPKCVRILKTSNSIYFKWEFHPHMSLSEYLRKSWLKIEEKIQISVSFLQTLAYLHHKNVVHCSITSQNIKIGEKSKVFLTNFKEALLFESDSEKIGINSQIMKRKQFQSLILRDIYDAAALLFEIFQFKKINPKFHVLSSNVESKLYKELGFILEKKIEFSSLDNLIKILSQKGNIRQTACTETSHNAPSPKLMKSAIKRSSISRDLDLERSSQTERNSVSCSKITLHNALKRAQMLRGELNGSRQSQTNLSSSFLKTSVPKSKLVSKTSLPDRSIYRSANEVKKIIGNRKLMNLMLEILNFIEKSNNLKLIYLSALKCEFYSELNRKLIEECSSNHLEKKEMDFLKIVNSENIKMTDFIAKLKESIKEIIQENSPKELSSYEAFEQASTQRKIEKIDQNLSNEIYQYLKRQISKEPTAQISQNTDQCQSQTYYKQTQPLTKSSKDVMRTKVKRTVSILENYPKKVGLNYQNYKFYYYLSIKLKYGSFDKFFQRKNTESQKYKVFEDEYFLPFENKFVPVEQIATEVKFRVEKFGQKMTI